MILLLVSLDLTEDMAVETGLKNYPILAADSLDMEALRMQVKEIGSSLWPKLEFQFGYSYNSYVTQMEMVSPVRWHFIEVPPGSGQGIAYPDSFVVDTFEFGRSHNYRFSVTLSRVLWSWGRMERGYFLQKDLLRSRWKDYEARKQAYAYTVRQVYVMTLLAKEAHGVAEESYKFAEENLKLVEEAYRNGRVTRLDYLRAKVNYENSRYNLSNARKSYEKAISRLMLILGLPDSVEINLKDTLALPDGSPDTTLQRADIEYIKEQARILKEIGKEEIKAFLPTLFGSVSYNYQRPLGFEDKWGSNWVATLGVNWTLFDGLKPYNSYRRYRYQADALRRRAVFLEQKARTDLRNALREYEGALERLKAAGEALKMASESFQLSREAYRNGRISYTDLKQVEVSYRNTLLNYKRAVADVRLSYWKAYYVARVPVE